MKLEFKSYPLSDFASEMGKLKSEKHFDFLVTIVGEDFGEEGLGCVYILENTDTHERMSVKMIAGRDGDEYYIPSVCKIWKAAELLEREVFDFYGIKFLGHPDMRRLYLRSDFQGYPMRKDYDMSPEKNKFPLKDDVEPDTTQEWLTRPEWSSHIHHSSSVQRERLCSKHRSSAPCYTRCAPSTDDSQR